MTREAWSLWRLIDEASHRAHVARRSHRLPKSRVELDRLTRRAGFPEGGTLVEHVERRQREIRAVYLTLLGA